MIAIVSSVSRERTALAALCASQCWAVIECESVQAIVRAIRRSRPHVVVVRHRLSDGYSDDVITALATAQLLPATKVIVLIDAGTPSAIEARQLSVGADYVQRDPARAEILLAYLSKLMRAAQNPHAHLDRPRARTFAFAGSILEPSARALRYRGKALLLTPRELALAELLADSKGEVLTYDTLFSSVIGRPFKGDTSNMRVLLGKLAASMRHIGISLRDWVTVIPKTGYRYRGTDAPMKDSKNDRAAKAR